MTTRTTSATIASLTAVSMFVCPRALSQPAEPLPAEEESKTLFEALHDLNLKLQRSVGLGQEAQAPARFAFVDDNDEGSVFTAEFALIWDPEYNVIAGDYFNATLQASMEAKLSSAADAANSDQALRFRTSLDYLWEAPKFGAFIGSMSFKYETDQDFDTEKYLLEFLISPALVPDWHIGAQPKGKGGLRAEKSKLYFMWRPTLGIEVGDNSNVGDSAEIDDTILRLWVRARVEIFMPEVASLFGLKPVMTDADGAEDSPVSLYLDNRFMYLPLEGEETTYNYLVTGLDFRVSENVTFGIEYKTGADAPKFQSVDTFGVTLGIQF